MSGKLEQELDRYFLPRETLAKKQNPDGKISHTYRAWLKKEYWRDSLPASFIIKEISESQASVYKILSHINHPNIEKVYGVLECEGAFCTVNEYIAPPSAFVGQLPSDQTAGSLSLEAFLQCCHGSLSSRALSHEEKTQQALLILLQLSEALKIIHEAGFIHGDIHPGNILLTDIPDGSHYSLAEQYGFYVKLIDFDNTRTAKGSDHTVTRMMGAKPFAAPEILDFAHPSDRADFYSLGCILYYAVYGESPKNISPNENRLHNKKANRIFRRCTASYEARYSNPAVIISDLKRALWIPSNPVSALLCKLPGFRTHTSWKMAIAAYIYISMLITLGYTLIAVFQRGLPLSDWQTNNLNTIFLFIVEICLVFDGFQIGEHFKAYRYFQNAHPVLNRVLKAVLALLIFIIDILLQYYI